MKLHLPSGLRKALLACLAALALPTAGISTTIASASGIAAAFAALQAQVEAAPTETAQKTQDVSDRSGIGMEGSVTYSGWIFSMNVGEATPEGAQNQPLYGGGSDNVHVKYYHWVPNAGGTGMEYSTSADGTVESWNGRQTPAPGPDGKTGQQLWCFFDNHSSSNASIYHTLRLEGGDSSTTYSITSDFHSDAYSLCFGGLIVEEGQGGFTVGGTGKTEKIVLKTGTAEGVNFEALILSDFAFTTRNRTDNLAVSVESNANFRVGAGITMDFGRWVKVAENMSLNLSRIGSTETEGPANVTMGRGLDLGDQASLVVGEGVVLTVNDILTGTESASLVLETDSNVTLKGSQSSVGRLQLAAGSNLTSINPLTIYSMLTVSGGVLNVTGKLGIIDNATEAVLTIDGGGTVSAASLGGPGDGHAGRLKVGGASTFGTLTVGTQANSYTGDAFMARSLYVQNKAEGEGEDSVVTIYGNANFYDCIQGQDSYAMIVDGKSKVTIDGTLHGNNANHVLRNVKLDNGGELSVKGAVTFGNNYGLEVANGTATLNGGVTASFINISQGSLKLRGSLNVTGGMSVSGGVVSLDRVTMDQGMRMTLRGTGILDLTTGGITSIGEGQKLTLAIERTIDGAGGKLRLTDAVMSSLTSSLENKIGISISGAKWDYQLFDLDGLNAGAWTAGRAENFLKTFWSEGWRDEYTLSVDDTGMVHFSMGGELTWTGGEGNVWDTNAHNWNDDKTGDTGEAFATNDSVTFGADGVQRNVIVSGGLEPGDIVVTGATTYTFTGQGGAEGNNSISAVGSLYVQEGSTASFGSLEEFSVEGNVYVQGASTASFDQLGTLSVAGNLYVDGGSTVSFDQLETLSVVGGTVSGSLNLGSAIEAKNLGGVVVEESGRIILPESTAEGWSGTMLSGDGTVVLDAAVAGGGEDGAVIVTVDQNNNLFAALFAAGDANIQRDGAHAGIGRFEVASGTTLVLADGNIGKGLSLIRNLAVQKGAILQLSANVLDNSDSGYTSVGTLVLSGGEEGEAAVLENTGAQVWVKWNWELEDDATVRNSGSGDFNITGSATLNAHGHTLTLEAPEGEQRTFWFGEASGTSSFGASEDSSGVVRLNSGVRLNFNTTNGASFSGYTMSLVEGSTLEMRKNATFGALSGTGDVSFSNSSVTMTLAGESAVAYTGTIASGGNGTIVVDNGATFLLGDGANIGNTVNVFGTLSTEAAQEDAAVKASASVRTLNVAEGAEVSLGEGSILSVGNLNGIVPEGSSSVDYGSITGAGTLRLTASTGSYGGNIGSDFEYDAAAGVFTLNGQFTGANLTVTSGTLALGRGNDDDTVREIPTVATVHTDGKLSLAAGNYGMVIYLDAVDNNTELLHWSGDVEIEVLSGKGRVTVENSENTLTISGEATEEQVFTGNVCPGGNGTVNLTGTMHLGDGASFGNTVKVTGTLAMPAVLKENPDENPDEDPFKEISATVKRLHVGEGGKVQLGRNTTLNVTELAGADGGYGSITGEGTLNLTPAGGGSGGTDRSFGGEISVRRLVYHGSGSESPFTLDQGFGGTSLEVIGGVLAFGANTMLGKEGEGMSWVIEGDSQLDLSAYELTLAATAVDLTIDARGETGSDREALKLGYENGIQFDTLQKLAEAGLLKLTLQGVEGRYHLLEGDELGVPQAELQEFLNNILWSTDERISVTIDVHGYLTVEVGHTLTWNPENTEGTWEAYTEEIENKPWIDNSATGEEKEEQEESGDLGYAFHDGDRVVFSDSTTTPHTITIAEGGVTAGKMTVQGGTWTFSGGALTVTGGLWLEGEGSRATFSGNGDKNFGGSEDSPGIHLGEGTELVITQGGDANWATGGANYVEGEGSIVLEGLTVNNGANGVGLLWVFMGAGDGTLTSPQIGALKLRNGTVLTMAGEMGGSGRGHALGNFKDIYVEDGSTLIISSLALGAKNHTNNVLHVAGDGAADQGGALVLNNANIDWDIKAEADATIVTGTGITYANHTLDLNGHTLTLALGAALTLNTGTVLSGDADGNSTLVKTGNVRMTMESGTITATEGLFGTIDVRGGELWVKDNDLGGWGVKLTEGATLFAGVSGAGEVRMGFLDGDGGVIENYTSNQAYHPILILTGGEGIEKTSGAMFRGASGTGTSYLNLRKEGAGKQIFSAGNFGRLHTVTVSGGELEFAGSGTVVGTVDLSEGSKLTLSGRTADTGNETENSVNIGGAVTLAGEAELVIGDETGEEINDSYYVQIADLSGESGTRIAGPGTLRLTAASGNFDGTVSSKLVYAGGSTGSYTLATYSGGDLTIESGTLKVTAGGIASLTRLTMNDGASLELVSGDLSLGVDGMRVDVTLDGSSALRFSALGGEEGQKLVLGGGAQLTEESEGSLRLVLSDALLEGWASGEVQLVEWGDKYNDWKDVIELDTSSVLNYKNLQLNEEGMLIWSEPIEEADYTWTNSQHEGSSFVWTSTKEDWDTRGAYVNDADQVVHILNDETGDLTIKIDGADTNDEGIVAGNLTLGGVGKIILQVKDGASVIALDTLAVKGNMEINVDADISVDTYVGGELRVGKHKTVYYMRTDAQRNTLQTTGITLMEESSRIYLEEDATLIMGPNANVKRKEEVEGECHITGTGTFEVDLDRNSSGAHEFDSEGVVIDEGVRVNLRSSGTNVNTKWDFFKNLDVRGTAHLYGCEVVLRGNNVIHAVDASEFDEEWNGNRSHITFDQNHESTIFETDLALEHAGFSVSHGTVTMHKLTTLYYTQTGGEVTVKGEYTTDEDGITREDGIAMEVNGNFTLNNSTLRVAGTLRVEGTFASSGGNSTLEADSLVLLGGADADFDSRQIRLSRDGRLVKNGGGRQQLRWATEGETYEIGGTVIVEAGILQLGNGYRTNNFSAGTLTVGENATFRLIERGTLILRGGLTLRQGGMVNVGGTGADGAYQNQCLAGVLEVNGALQDGSLQGNLGGSINLYSNGGLVIKHIKSEENKADNALGELSLKTSGGNTYDHKTDHQLTFLCDKEGYASINLGNLSAENQTQSLTIMLRGLDTYVEAHADQEDNGGWDFDLFNLGVTPEGEEQQYSQVRVALLEMYRSEVLTLGNLAYEWELTEDGHVLITRRLAELSWSAGEGDHGQWMIWQAGLDTGSWDGGQDWSPGQRVRFKGNGQDATITLAEDVQTGKLVTEGRGRGTFIFDGGHTITVSVVEVGTNCEFRTDMQLEGEMSIQGVQSNEARGKTVTFNGGTLRMQEGGSVYLGEGATLDLENATLSHGSGEERHRFFGDGGTVRVGVESDLHRMNFEEGVTVEVVGSPVEASTLTDLEIGGLLKYSGMGLNLAGTNEIGSMDVEKLNGMLTLGEGHVSTTITGEEGLTLAQGFSATAGAMTVNKGNFEVSGEFTLGNGASVTVLGGSLILHDGVSNSGAEGDEGVVYVQMADLNDDPGAPSGDDPDAPSEEVSGDLQLLNADGGDSVFVGSVSVEGNLSKAGAGKQTIRAGAENSTFWVGGNVSVEEGVLELSSDTAGGEIDGDVTVSAGSFSWQGEAGLAVGGSVTASGTGEFGMTNGRIAGSLTVESEARAEFSVGTTTVTGRIEAQGEVSLRDGGVLDTLGGELEQVSIRSGAVLKTGDVATIGRLVVDGGGLEVKDNGTLTIGEIQEGGELTHLHLGAVSTLNAGGLRLQGAGAITWEGSALLNLQGSEKIRLGEGFSLEGQEMSEGRLRIHLTQEFLNQYEQSGSGTFFALSEGVVWDSAWSQYFLLECDATRTYNGLHIDEDGYLVWEGRVGVEWTGGHGGTWSDDDNWVNANDPNRNPEGQDVYFTDEADGNVNIDGNVSPKNVFVDSGEYQFVGDGGINMQETGDGMSGALVVGGNGRDAKLTLNVDNVNLPTIRLEKMGTLVVARKDALTGSVEDGNATKIKFMGGVLEYSGDVVLEGIDLSRYVADRKEGSTEMARVNVSNDEAYEGQEVVWGRTEVEIQGDDGEESRVEVEVDEVKGNSGLRLALDEKGMEKGGDGHLTLEWKDVAPEIPENPEDLEIIDHAGEIAVRGGELEYKVHHDAENPVESSRLGGDATVDEAGTLILTVAEDSSGTLDYAGKLAGKGSVELRANEGTVRVSGDNSGFGGRIVINASPKKPDDTDPDNPSVSASSEPGGEEPQLDTRGAIVVQETNALGGAGTTLVLESGKLTGDKQEEMEVPPTQGEEGGEPETVMVQVPVEVQAGTVAVTGTDGVGTRLSYVTLTGKVTGEGTVTAANEVALTGSLSEFKGSLNTEELGIWKIQSDDRNLAMKLAGAGIVNFAAEGETTFSGSVEGSLVLEQSGDGILTVTSVDTSKDAKLKGNITLGNAAALMAVWNGSELVDGDEDGSTVITLANVELGVGGITTKGDEARLNVNTAVGGRGAATRAADVGSMAGTVNVNGMDGSMLDNITINEGGQLIGVTGTYAPDRDHRMLLYFGEENATNVEEQKGDRKALIVGRKDSEQNDFRLEVAKNRLEVEVEGEDEPSVDYVMQVAFSSDIYGLLRESEKANKDAEQQVGKVWLRLLQSGTVDRGGEEISLDLTKMDDGVAQLLGYSAELELEEDGYLLLSGTTDNLYIVMDGEFSDKATVDQEGLLVGKDSVIVLDRKTLTLQMNGADANRDNPVLRNLLGTKGTTLHVINEAWKDAEPDKKGDRVTLVLDNTWVDEIRHDSTDLDGALLTQARGVDTVFEGSILGGVIEEGEDGIEKREGGVDVNKTGLGTLTVGGDYTLVDGSTTIVQGALVLRGESNRMEDLNFAYVTKQDTAHDEDQRGLVLDGGTTTIVGRITDLNNSAEGNDIVLRNNANLELEGESELASTSIIGEGWNTGTVTLKKNEEGKGASLSFVGPDDADGDGKADAHLSGVAVQMEDGTTLDVGKGNNRLTALNGAGTLKSDGSGTSENSGTLTVGGGSFSGRLDVSGSGSAGTLAVEAGKSFTLNNATGAAQKHEDDSAWDVKLGNGSRLTVDVSGRSYLALGDVTLGNGNLTVDFGNRALDGKSLEATIVSAGENGLLEFRGGSLGSVEKEGTGIKVGQGVDREAFKNQVKFTGVANFLKDHEVTIGDDGMVTVTMKESMENKFERVMPDANKNALAGASMVWDSLKEKSQTQSFFDVLSDPESDYKRLINDLIVKYDNGDNSDLERALTSVAGASIATIAPAFMEDLHRQIKTIRNRTTTMAGDVNYEAYDTLPLWHAWINGEGGYHKLEADGYLPGYTLNNWGGTVGVDIDVTPRTTIGLALSAMYGDLKPDSADSATGQLDTTYLSAFVRANRGSWIHTFVVSGGLADIKLDRTVNYGSSSYHANGSTDGYAFGAMYEVGYTQLMNESGTVALQPVFNVEVRHVNVGGYSESGSDAGLKVDDVKQDLVTFGVGARLQSVVGSNTFNRTAIFEARALLKADVGDRSGRAKNGIVDSDSMAEVESAEVGALGVEVGAGISIPLGVGSGSIFLDASLEWRRGWTSADASVGYRINF